MAAVTVVRAKLAKLPGKEVEPLSEDALQVALSVRPFVGEPTRPMPDCVYLHTKLRLTGITLALLHAEHSNTVRDVQITTRCYGVTLRNSRSSQALSAGAGVDC